MTQPDETAILRQITSRLKEQQSVRISLPVKGVLNIDQPVPFLLVYRFPPDGKDHSAWRLGLTETSYLMGTPKPASLFQSVVATVSRELSNAFGAFMLLEIWLSDREIKDDFIIHTHHKLSVPVAETLKQELESIVIGTDHFSAVVEKTTSVSPPGFKPVLSSDHVKKTETLLVGLEIKPSYINETTGKPYPIFFRDFRKAFGKALKKTFFEFVRLNTSFSVAHFSILGKTVIDELVWQVDEKLAEYSNQFDLLFLVTPVNLKDTWKEFSESHFQKPPIFHYRHMPVDPELIKRKLFELPIEEIEDPTIAFLFRDKRKEIDRMLNMIAERERPDFVLSSLQVYGRVDETLLDIAKALLVATPASEENESTGTINAEEFAAVAREELEYLRQQHPAIGSEVSIRDDIDGILVSKGVLFISRDIRIDASRVNALIQHEIGTHVVTYYNGRAQPFRLFYSGVPGYEQLQEGLAVLAEYIMDGLTNSRLRTLAARVVAVNQMISGHSFVDTFHLLADQYLFTPKSSFSITMRTYRGGGLTKDAIYLKGLQNLLEYIKGGHDIAPLLIGKIREDYIPIVEELIYRKLLKPIPIIPRYLQEQYRERLETLKKGITVFNMVRQ